MYNVVFFFLIKKNTWRYHYFTPVHQKSWWYDLQFLRYRVWQTEIGNYGSLFALLPPPKNPKDHNFKIMKKLLEISSFYTSISKTTIIWGTLPETEWNRQDFLSFTAIFCPFNPLNPRKTKILKKWKKHLEISSFYTSVP